MREIKFRGWNNSIKQMLPPQDLTQSRKYWNWLGVCDVNLMQYTGLKDKNGTEIYDGDIVFCEAKEGDKEETGARLVRWSIDLSWCLAKWGNNFGLPLTWGGWKSLEVIGNIYENQQLLNQKQ